MLAESSEKDDELVLESIKVLEVLEKKTGSKTATSQAHKPETYHADSISIDF